MEGYSASDNWEYSHTFRGVMTHYKREKNLLWLKLCGDLEGAMVFDQVQLGCYINSLVLCNFCFSRTEWVTRLHAIMIKAGNKKLNEVLTSLIF